MGERKQREDVRICTEWVWDPSGVLSTFFFNDTATTEIYPLSLHDALPISRNSTRGSRGATPRARRRAVAQTGACGVGLSGAK